MPDATPTPSIAPRPCPLRSGLLCPNALYSPLAGSQPGLDATADQGATLLFVHLPRCRHDCAACDCQKQRLRDGHAIDRYLAALLREFVQRAGDYAGPAIRHLHFSGGTCTLPDAGALTQLMYHLAEIFPLADEGERSFSAEADPHSLDNDRLALLRGLGVNQIALDVGRIGTRTGKLDSLGITASRLTALVDEIRHHGFHTLRLDVNYGHPVYESATVLRSIDALLDVQPERISANHYRSVRVSCAKTSQPLGAVDQQLRSTLQSTLENSGYRRISHCATDHFIRKDLADSADRNAEVQQILAFGVSTVSRLPSGLSQANPSNLALWQLSHAAQLGGMELPRR
jgi:coproporphyrinogen III oxidase-like Fe-S oxidoreductase